MLKSVCDATSHRVSYLGPDGREGPVQEQVSCHAGNGRLFRPTALGWVKSRDADKSEGRRIMSSTPSMDESLSQADFVFNGTVEEAGATTMSAVAATDSTAVVRVDEVVQAPSAFAGLAHQRITVLLREPQSVQPGEQATFFVNGAVFGDSIAVQEVDHRVTTAAAELARRVAEVRDRVRDSEVGARVASADVIVAGRVAQVRAAAEVAETEPGLPGPFSEHYPDWMEAVLDIESVLKGARPQDPTVLLFPASIDVMWVKSPKFHAGQEGIWLLHAEQVPQAAARAFPSVYTALSVDDFQPKVQAERIRGMVEQLGG